MNDLRDANRWMPIMALAVLVNVLLFAGLPNMLSREVMPTDTETVQAVDFLRENPGRREAPAKEKPPEPPPEPPRVVPRQVSKALTPSVQAPRMDLPAFDFDVSPDMGPGIPVTAPRAPVAAAPQPASPKAFYGLEEVDQGPVATMKTEPPYPYRARRLRLSGKVDVRFLVDAKGQVGRIAILKSDPPDVFDRSVLQTLSTWRFSPGTVSGRPVNTWVTTTIVFKLEES
ncbi:TonB family protein [uncultured Desulfosarcina sp.]|uniref:energy transducer TonB n=1 Tax=uncultured Desulfosarcina sp. TaxID=218289 RepID=UPI003747B5C5